MIYLLFFMLAHLRGALVVAIYRQRLVKIPPIKILQVIIPFIFFTPFSRYPFIFHIKQPTDNYAIEHSCDSEQHHSHIRLNVHIASESAK